LALRAAHVVYVRRAFANGRLKKTKTRLSTRAVPLQAIFGFEQAGNRVAERIAAVIRPSLREERKRWNRHQPCHRRRRR